MNDYVYKWRTDIHRNPLQLRANREMGKRHPPALRKGNIWWQGPEVWTVTAVYSSIMYPVDLCASFEDAIAYLNAEYHEWRYVSTKGTVWTAERYQGGSGPVGELVITRRRLSKRS